MSYSNNVDKITDIIISMNKNGKYNLSIISLLDDGKIFTTVIEDLQMGFNSFSVENFEHKNIFGKIISKSTDVNIKLKK